MVRDRPHNVLGSNRKSGSLSQKKRVATTFLFPIWPLVSPERSFLPCSGQYGRCIADRWLEMLLVRKLCATSPNLLPKLEPKVVLAIVLDSKGAKSHKNSSNWYRWAINAGAGQTTQLAFRFLGQLFGPEVELKNRMYLLKCLERSEMSSYRL